jgi:hypothetical protein
VKVNSLITLFEELEESDEEVLLLGEILGGLVTGWDVVLGREGMVAPRSPVRYT